MHRMMTHKVPLMVAKIVHIKMVFNPHQREAMQLPAHVLKAHSFTYTPQVSWEPVVMTRIAQRTPRLQWPEPPQKQKDAPPAPLERHQTVVQQLVVYARLAHTLIPLIHVLSWIAQKTRWLLQFQGEQHKIHKVASLAGHNKINLKYHWEAQQ